VSAFLLRLEFGGVALGGSASEVDRAELEEVTGAERWVCSGVTFGRSVVVDLTPVLFTVSVPVRGRTSS
jgi:hypothetical protein